MLRGIGDRWNDVVISGFDSEWKWKVKIPILISPKGGEIRMGYPADMGQ